LNLAPLFATLDAHALEIPCEVSKNLDRRTRALQKAVIDGILSVPAEQLQASGGLDELTRMFSHPDAAQQLMPAPAASEVGAQTAFEQARQGVDAIESMADFLFASLTVKRPAGLSLPDFLRIGMRLRRRTGIDCLERTLMQSPTAAQQEPLCAHALQALRRTQQRLLAHVLQQLPSGASAAVANGVVEAVADQLMLNGHAIPAQTTVEHAVLDVWALSESAMSGTGAAQQC
jgi:glutamate dehydrogenase